MTLRRALASSTVAVFLVAALAACFGAAPAPANPTYDLTGTSWSGTDSVGDFWGFEFQSDGTVGLTYNADSYDDPADVWEVTDGALTVTTAFDEGDVVFTGAVSDGTMNLSMTTPNGPRTVTVTEE